MTDTQTASNFLGIPAKYTDYSTSKVVMLPLPFDKTCSYQSGTSKGPQAIIEASKNVELYDIETNSEPYTHGIFTAPPIIAEDGTELNTKAYLHTKQFINDGKFVISLGGEHSVSYGPIRAHAEHYTNFSILQLDAHTDLREQYDGNPLSHACIMARSKEFTNNIVQVGIRSMDKAEFCNIDRKKLFLAEQIHDQSRWIPEAVDQLSDNVYITIDLDVFELGLMPSTGTPEPGGLGWYQVLQLLRLTFENKNVVGCDIVELSPNKNNLAPDFLSARLAYKLIGYKLCLNN